MSCCTRHILSSAPNSLFVHLQCDRRAEIYHFRRQPYVTAGTWPSRWPTTYQPIHARPSVIKIGPPRAAPCRCLSVTRGGLSGLRLPHAHTRHGRRTPIQWVRWPAATQREMDQVHHLAKRKRLRVASCRIFGSSSNTNATVTKLVFEAQPCPLFLLVIVRGDAAST